MFIGNGLLNYSNLFFPLNLNKYLKWFKIRINPLLEIICSYRILGYISIFALVKTEPFIQHKFLYNGF